MLDELVNAYTIVSKVTIITYTYSLPSHSVLDLTGRLDKNMYMSKTNAEQI